MERQTNIVISDELYLTSMVEKDIFGDESELIHIDGHIAMGTKVNYMQGRKEFLEQEVNKKKEILLKIKNKFKKVENVKDS